MEAQSKAGQTLGQYLLAARERAKIGTRQLAVISGVERSAIVRLEADKVDVPDPENLIRLADPLELNASDLFILAGIPIPKELPSLAPYLRTKYDLPPEALAEAQESIRKILEKYDQDTNES